MDLGAIATALVIAAILGLVQHIRTDIETRRDLRNLTKRVAKLDGINGHNGEH